MALASLFMFASCSQEQSQVNEEVMCGSFTVKGTVKYLTGFEVVKSALEQKDAIAKSGAQVLLSVDYSEYDANAQGVKQFFATTDANGKYSFEIPVGLKPLAATLEVIAFEGEYSDWDTEDGEYVIITKKAIYNANNGPIAIGIENGKLEVIDFEISDGGFIN